MIYKPGVCQGCHKQMEITNLVVTVFRDDSARHAGLCWRATYDAYCHNCKKDCPLKLAYGRLPPEFQDAAPALASQSVSYAVFDEVAVLDPAVWYLAASGTASELTTTKAKKRKPV